MPSIHSDNWFYVLPGEPAFNVMSNMCGSFLLGDPHGDDVWLHGDIVGEEAEFVFNGRLFLADGKGGTVIDNFPKSVPHGWTRRQRMDESGYELVDARGEVVFGYQVIENGICQVTVNLYRKDGTLAAHPGQGGLVSDGINLGFGGPSYKHHS